MSKLKIYYREACDRYRTTVYFSDGQDMFGVFDDYNCGTNNGNAVFHVGIEDWDMAGVDVRPHIEIEAKDLITALSNIILGYKE